jgi:hypothetical protein
MGCSWLAISASEYSSSRSLGNPSASMSAGRSYPLRFDYRTSHQIRSHADQLLPTALADVDGNLQAGASCSICNAAGQ